MWDSYYPPAPRDVVVPLPQRSGLLTLSERVAIFALALGNVLPFLWPMVLVALFINLICSWESFWSSATLGLFAITVAAIGAIRGFSYRTSPIPHDLRTVSANDQPGLWNFIDHIVFDQSARRPDGLFVNASEECRWFDRWSPWTGLRSHLVIGQWVIELCSLSELKALLSIQLARTRGTNWEQRRTEWQRALELRLWGQDSWSSSDSIPNLIVRGCSWFSLGPVWLIQYGLLRLVRQTADPFAQDTVAGQLTGTDATLLAISRLDQLPTIIESVDSLLIESARLGFFLENVFTTVPDAMHWKLDDEDRQRWLSLVPPRTPTLARDREWFDLAAPYQSESWLGFPEADRREEQAKRHYHWNELDGRPSTLLIEKLPNVRRELTARFMRRLGWDLSNRHPVSISLFRRWLSRNSVQYFPASVGRLYEEGRMIEPGSKHDRETAHLPDTSLLLWNSLSSIYGEAESIWSRWSETTKRLDKIDAKRERTRKDEIQTEHLKRARREAVQSLAGYDLRLHVIHRQLASELPTDDLGRSLARITYVIVRFQTTVAQTRQWTRVLDQDRETLRETISPSPKLLREINNGILESLDRLEELLEGIKELDQPEISGLIEQLPLEQFLSSIVHFPDGRRGALSKRLDESWLLWREVQCKAEWLHVQLVSQMTRIHESIVQAFAEQQLVSAEPQSDSQ